MGSIDYKSYLSYSAAEKVSLFDSGVPLSKFKTDKSKRKFLEHVIESNDNNFLWKKALENLALMPIFGETSNNNAALSILLDIEPDDDPFVLTTKIKYLFLLYEKFELSDQGIIGQIDDLRFHENSEVSSEAYYYMGLKNFFDANLAIDNVNFLERIRSAARHFEGAVTGSENRVDADLQLQICRLIEYTLLGKLDLGGASLSTIKDILIERKYSYIYSKIPDFELWIYKVASGIYEVRCSKTDEWLCIKSEVNEICNLHYQMIDFDLDSCHYQGIKKISESVGTYLLEPFYKESLYQYLGQIKRLHREAAVEEPFRSFCSYLIKSIEEGDSKKKPNIDVALLISSKFPHVDQEKLKEDISTHDLSDPKSLIRLVGRYLDELPAASPGFITGSRVGDEIFKYLAERLGSLVPSYPAEKFLEFKLVLSDVIRYATIAASQKKTGEGLFKFLFDENATEGNLQESMYAYLQMSPVGTKYKPEVSEVADGGRVDILYTSDKVVIPIELKRTKSKPTKESIAKKYLGQAQTYCYPHDQLGLFVLLDNSSKADELARPMNDIREHFDIQHMKPYYDVEQKAPNYVVTVIVPGNKITPSQRSKYT